MVEIDKLRVLVTGGSGFIGTNLVDYYIGRGASVLNIDIKPPRNNNHINFWINHNILDINGIRELINKFDPHFIFHMAARTDLKGVSINDYKENTDGVRNILEVSQNLKNLKISIYASSKLVCKPDYVPKNNFDYCPSTIYGESKVIGEKIVSQMRLCISSPVLIVRPTSIWGPWFSIPYKNFFSSIRRGFYVHPGHSRILKSFGYVGNFVYQLDKLASHLYSNDRDYIYYIADYEPINLREMANSIQRSFGSKKIRTISIGILRVFAYLGDFLCWIGMKEPPLTSFRYRNLMMNSIYDLTPLKMIVGSLPYSMDDGVKATVLWMSKYEDSEKA